jgi:hypothetical protein
MSQKLQIKDNSSEKIKRRRKETNLSPEERLVNQRHRSVPFKSALLLLIENRHLKEKHDFIQLKRILSVSCKKNRFCLFFHTALLTQVN